MSLVVNTNVSSLTAQRALAYADSLQGEAMQRLSTGSKINSASDDAAGVSIASRLSSEVRGTNQAIRNAMDAQSMIDTAEGGHKEVEDILQRMRELAVQAANDTNDTTDRTQIKTEFDELVVEIDRIKDVTSWAGTKLLDGTGGSSGSFNFQIGSGTLTADKLAITITSISTSTLGVGSLTVASLSSAQSAITAIDTAIKTLNTQRSKLGSYSNRLDHTVSNLTNISNNLQAGLGRIEDADFAAETTNLAKTQILQQASTAMLAQANASKQNVLSLLQG